MRYDHSAHTFESLTGAGPLAQFVRVGTNAMRDDSIVREPWVSLNLTRFQDCLTEAVGEALKGHASALGVQLELVVDERYINWAAESGIPLKQIHDQSGEFVLRAFVPGTQSEDAQKRLVEFATVAGRTIGLLNDESRIADDVTWQFVGGIFTDDIHQIRDGLGKLAVCAKAKILGCLEFAKAHLKAFADHVAEHYGPREELVLRISEEYFGEAKLLRLSDPEPRDCIEKTGGFYVPIPLDSQFLKDRGRELADLQQLVQSEIRFRFDLELEERDDTLQAEIHIRIHFNENDSRKQRTELVSTMQDHLDTLEQLVHEWTIARSASG